MTEKEIIKTSVGQAVTKMTVTIDGVTIPIVPAITVASRLGYSLRHVQNLCNWQQLIAIKICGIWFVHELEIELYRQYVRQMSQSHLTMS